MDQRVVLLGTGKMACAFACQYRRKGMEVIQLGRDSFNALDPAPLTKILTDLAPDIVCNTVVFGGLDQCFEDPVGAWRVNALFPVFVARLGATLGFHCIHLSTDAVFADTAPGIGRFEPDAATPPNMYGMTKYGADCLIPSCTDRYHIFRLPVLFGPGPQRKHFLEKLLLLGIARGSLQISDNIYSNAAYSMDVAQYIVNNAVALHPGLYHLAGEEACSLYELMCEATEILQVPVRVTPVSSEVFPSKDYKNTRVLLRSEKIPPLRSWRSALQDYCREWKEYLVGKRDI